MPIKRHISPSLRVITDEDISAHINKELVRMNSTRTVLVCGSTLASSSTFERLCAKIGKNVAGVYSGVSANSPRTAVESCSQYLKSVEADAVVALGGGSAMVTARAATILAGENASLETLCGHRTDEGKLIRPLLREPKLPILAIPSTPSTAIVKAGAAVLDTDINERMTLFDPSTRPTSILIDTTLLQATPETLFNSAALNTLSSAMEGLLHSSTDPISQGMLIHAIHLIIDGLLEKTQDEGSRRYNLTMAAIMVGRGTDNTGLGIATAISHVLTTKYYLDSGAAKAMLLPHLLTKCHTDDALANRLLALALNCQPEQTVQACEQLNHRLSVTPQLRDLGIPASDVTSIAKHCMTDWFSGGQDNPQQREQEILQILEAAW